MLRATRWECRECERRCEMKAKAELRPDKCPFDALGFYTGPNRWQKAKPKKKRFVFNGTGY